MSIVASILVNYLLNSTRNICIMVEGLKCKSVFDHMLETSSILINIVVLFLIYIIWSLIQKKQ